MSGSEAAARRCARSVGMESISLRPLVDVQRYSVFLFHGGCMAVLPVEHGGRALAFARARNIDYREIVDFSANINPLGPSPRAMAALRESLEIVQVYPDET